MVQDHINRRKAGQKWVKLGAKTFTFLIDYQQNQPQNFRIGSFAAKAGPRPAE